MENLVLVFVILIVVHYLYRKVKSWFQQPSKPAVLRGKVVEKEFSKATDRRDAAIADVMKRLEKINGSREEIIREDPDRARAVLKMWAKQDR